MQRSSGWPANRYSLALASINPQKRKKSCKTIRRWSQSAYDLRLPSLCRPLLLADGWENFFCLGRAACALLAWSSVHLGRHIHDLVVSQAVQDSAEDCETSPDPASACALRATRITVGAL